VENQKAFNNILTDKINTLDTENSAKAQRIGDLQREIDFHKTQLTRIEADQQVLVRQLEVLLAQVQEHTAKIEEYRVKLAKSLNEKSLSVADRQYAVQLSERLQQDLSALEEKHVEMAREKKHIEEKINALNQAGVNTNVAPKKPLEAKVTEVANEIGLVVISIGKDDGVLEGDEFTIYRGGDFVAKIVISRSDRKWSSGNVVLKKADPRVADDASNHIFMSGRSGGR
jgi:predicted RNase H-like nuclease (RuvC/YqgF family)